MAPRTRVVFATHRVPSDDEVLLAIPALSGSSRLQIQSVFIRDANLRIAANLPFTREILPSGTVRNLSLSKIDDHYRSMANRLRERVETLAVRLGYPTTFSEVEARDYSALSPLTDDADFVAITQPDVIAPVADHNQGEISPVVQCRTTTLFVNEPWLSGTSVVVAYEGTRTDVALEIADRYATQAKLPLVVIAPKGLDCTTIEAQHTVHFSAEDWNDAAIAALCRQHDARLLVLGTASHGHWQAVARLLIETTPCSILQVVTRA